MAEVIITIPITLILMAGIDYFSDAYMARIDALSVARHEAFKLANDVKGECFKNKHAWSGFTIEDATNLGVDTANAAIATQGASQGQSMFLYNHAVLHVERASGRKLFSSSPPSLKGEAFVTCNELAPEKSDNVFGALETLITSSFK
jgi:hypothetical protein